MIKRKRVFGQLSPVAALIGVLAATGAAPSAHAQAADDAIHACVNKASGNIRVVNAATNCQTNETAVSLSTQTSSSGAGPQIVDSQGQTVGALVRPGYAMRQLDGVWADLPMSASGFFESPAQYFVFYHTEAGCAGTRYLPADVLPVQAQINNDTAYFPNGSSGVLTIMSAETFAPGQSLADSGSCSDFSSYPYHFEVGPLDGVALGPLALVPPFSIQ